MNTHNNILILDDAADQAVIPQGTKWIWFENNKGRSVNHENLGKMLSEEKNIDFIEGVRICGSSQLRSLNVLRVFKNLKTLDINGGKLLDFEELKNLASLESLSILVPQARKCSLEFLPRLKLKHLAVKVKNKDDSKWIGQCNTLTRLSLVSWPLADFQLISELGLEFFVASMCSNETCAGINTERLDRVEFGVCTRLNSFERLHCRKLIINSCNRIALESLQGSKLCTLKLQEQKVLSSFRFIKECNGLKDLAITATRITAKDFEFIIKSKSLRRVWLCPPVKGKEIRDISIQNPRVVITNGEECFFQGENYDLDKFYIFPL